MVQLKPNNVYWLWIKVHCMVTEHINSKLQCSCVHIHTYRKSMAFVGICPCRSNEFTVWSLFISVLFPGFYFRFTKNVAWFSFVQSLSYFSPSFGPANFVAHLINIRTFWSQNLIYSVNLGKDHNDIQAAANHRSQVRYTFWLIYVLLEVEHRSITKPRWVGWCLGIKLTVSPYHLFPWELWIFILILWWFNAIMRLGSHPSLILKGKFTFTEKNKKLTYCCQKNPK